MRLALLAPRYWHTWLGLGVLRAIEPLPYRALLGLGRVFGWILRRLPLKYVRIARCNLALCMPELDHAAREKLLDAHCMSLGIGLCETSLTWWSDAARIASLAEVHGREHLAAALAKGRGVIMLGGHFTTIEIATRVLNSLGPVNVLYRATKNAALSEFMHERVSRYARRAVQHDQVRDMIKALRANEILWYAPDQSYRNKGAVMVPFFGIPAATNTGTSRIARLSGAQVLTCFTVRLPDAAGYRLVIGPALENFPGDDAAADALRYHHLLEAQIRQAPEQYLWMHRRFKGLTADYPDYYGRDSRASRPSRLEAQ